MLTRRTAHILLGGLVVLILTATVVVGGIRLYRHMHRPPAVVRLTIPTVRTMEDLAGRISRVIDADSVEIMAVFGDSVLIDSLGFNHQTLPALFIPNTYEVWQSESPLKLLLRLKREHDAYWTAQRLQQAEAQQLTPVEVMTLASIVEQETANDAERPMIAGMYLNRLRRNMPLQADPTVKFALQDFALRRILHEHLEVDSPYNTYKNPGLPPGPICIPSLASIKAVLSPASHNYIYMCAREDFSGTHNFAETYNEHLRNAHKYARALNEAGIQ
ncbi:MAG: endolytic transglycosylase MltG [Bacteroidaceae bacterium]|nr:endolytic transglycosylase MltG [Bacteroidaceae bacterium]